MKMQISLSAELTDEQTLALRTHVLPLFTPLFADGTYKFSSRWYDPSLDPVAKVIAKKRRNMPGQGRTPNADKIKTALFYASRVAVLLEIVVGKKGTPAQRAAALHKQLAGDDWATKNVAPEKLYAGMLLRLKNILPLKGLVPGVKAGIQALLVSPYTTKLMAKTWPYIVQELRTEIPSLIKQYKLMAPPSSKDRYYYQNDKQWPKIKERFIAYTKSLGFKEVPTAISYDEEKSYVSMLRDDGVYLIGKPNECNPGFQIDGSGRYSWDRLGVDSGGYQWNDSNSIEAVVDDCIEKCVIAIEKRKHRDTNGTLVQFCPQKSQTLLPEELNKIVTQLKNGQSYTIAPGGFGTAYVFSTRKRYSDARPASEDISKRVGSPVYYTTEDRD